MSATIWTDEIILELLQEDLGRRNPSEGTAQFLLLLIQTAKSEISREGVEIPETITDYTDALLVEMYAAYLYRKRAATGEDSHMPRALRYMLNNRVFSNREGTA